MSIVKRTVAVYRRGGSTEIVKRVAARLKPHDAAYQEKLDTAFHTRWDMIRSQIPLDAGSLLDVGSNLGAFTAAAARQGLWSVGIEKMLDLARKAQQLHAAQPDCGFMCTELNLDTCRKLPNFDVVLLLSVHHHWHNAFGKAVADEMLEILIGKSRVLIFEGPARPGRYTRERPDFTANDEESVTTFYENLLTGIVGTEASVAALGKSHCVGEREPHRWMYSIT